MGLSRDAMEPTWILCHYNLDFEATAMALLSDCYSSMASPRKAIDL